MTVKRFIERIFKTRVIFITDAEPKEVEEYVKKRFPKEEEIRLAGFEGMCFRCDDSYEIKHYIIWLRDSSQYYTLSHELVHLVEWRFKDLGMKFEGEQVAYYHEYWMKKLWREISNRKEAISGTLSAKSD